MVKKRAKRRAWSAEHVRKLKMLAGKKKGATNIGRTLKRTEGAIRQKAFSLGLSLETRAGSLLPKTVGEGAPISS